ncbi:MAG: hypothetical protein H0X71_01440 [Rubrobacter sp.]|nr:hypothetical protein [Rubrobacter sp.]
MLQARFGFDDTSAYINQKCFVIAVDDLYLLGVLNSSPIWELILQGSPILRGGYVEPRRVLILSLPIPNAPAADREAITSLVQKCLDAKGVGCEEWEAEIDGRVAALYGL